LLSSALGGVVDDASIRVGGDKFDDAIVRLIKKQYNVLIGERTAEEIKIQIGTVLPGGEVMKMEVRGRDTINGLPKTITVTSEDTMKALEEPVGTMISKVRSVLEKCPPELSADIVDNGICLTGGGALLRGITTAIEKETGIRTFAADKPLDCVAIGTGKALENLDKLRPGTVFSNSVF
jgi:rod shape-determining protein MreB